MVYLYSYRVLPFLVSDMINPKGKEKLVSMTLLQYECLSVWVSNHISVI